MDATNHKTEQVIRPAVVNRKVWGGNRTGTRAQSVLMSVLRTAAQRGIDSPTSSAALFKARLGQQPRPMPDTGWPDPRAPTPHGSSRTTSADAAGAIIN